MHFAVAVALVAFGSASASETKESTRPRLLIADYFANRVLILERDGSISWSFEANRPLDAWQLSNGDVLFCYRTGVMRVRPNLSKANGQDTRNSTSNNDGTRIIWEYTSEAPNETHGCQPLPNDSVLVGLSCKTPMLMEIDSRGNVTKEIPIRSDQTRIHSQMRCVRKTPQGTYLVAQNKSGVVREYDGEGSLIRDIPLPGCNPYLAVPLPNRNVLIGGGDGHRFVEIDQKGQIVWDVGQHDLPNCPIWFAGGVHRLPNGNTILCNYAGGGHGEAGEQAHLIEITPDKKTVWTLSDYPRFQGITSVQSLNIGGSPEAGDILK